MADVKRMTPLFYEGKFNCKERKMQVVYSREVSNDKDRYRLWVRAGKPDNPYPRNESDQYSLYAEIRGYYKDDGTLVETSLILYLMREYHINVPLRTQGWIKERLTTATVQEDFCGSVTYYRAKKSPCSQKFFDCMRDLIQAVHDAKEAAA